MTINITGKFLHDTMYREPNHEPRNHVGCGVVAELSVQLAYPKHDREPYPFHRPAKSLTARTSRDPRNRTGKHAL